MEASALYPDGRFMVEDLLDFTLGAGDEDDDDETKTFKAPSSSSSNPSFQDPDDHHHQSLALPEFVEEEELEWLSNKDAFPAVETCLDILSGNPGTVPNHQGLLENSSSSSSNNSNGSTITSCCAGRISVPVGYPVKARSKRRWRPRHGISEQWSVWSQAKAKKGKPELPPPPPPSATPAIGRRCLHCRAEKTPQWRAGPMGPKTLCNACGVRYKSGRLVPEYRPASSPTFSNLVHSNSHRKIIEMRRQKQPGGMVNEACGYRVG